MIRVGVDTGGTFTDLVRLSDGAITIHKVRSTPSNPSLAVLAGMAEMRGEVAGEAVAEVIHGSTVATNAVLERRGARVALVATKGFEDVLAIGRQTRRELYNFMVRGSVPMVDAGLTFGIAERLDHQGRVVQDLLQEDLNLLTEQLLQAKAECVAVCLLHSYANPAHEERIAAHLTRAGLLVCTSSGVLPEYREYERWSTTVVNAYVTPIMARYLHSLEAGLAGTRLRIMQSNGGLISAGQARSSAVRTILSGPAAGAIGAHAVASASGFARVVLFDMGGTSTDVSLIDGQIGTTSESVVGDFPVRLPMLDIHTVGAGGGSVAYVDAGGSLRVGPRSAGAEPGPVCYGKGEELTVTDANLLLGRLDAGHFLGGRMAIYSERTQARAEEFAARLGITTTRLAEGIVQISNANMERAIRAVSVQRGYDPREFALLAFGGAGGMHACEIAASMEIATVLVPEHAGVLSALGMLLADVRKDYSQTVLRPADGISMEELQRELAPLVAQAEAELAMEGAGETVIEGSLDMRYVGQAYEIHVPLTPGFHAAFHARHQQLYGYSDEGRATEIVNVRVNAARITEKYVFPRGEDSAKPLVAPVKLTQAVFDGRYQTTAVYRREALAPGMAGQGPAIVSGGQATVVIPPQFRFSIDAVGTLVATRMDGAEAGTGEEKP